MQAWRDGPTPHNARNRKAALVGSPRMSAAMEAAMTRKLYAFATPGVRIIVGAKHVTRPPNPDAPLKRL
jgi:hypothetical protein